jgi:prevent-host-death family protein
VVIAMIKETPAMTVRQNLGELLSEVQYRRDRILITKAGKPVAALVDIETFERLRKLDEEFERLRTELARSFEKLPETEGVKLVDEVVRAVKKKKPARR